MSSVESSHPFSRVLPSSSEAYTVFNVPEEQLPELERRMRPGGYSTVGFLSQADRLIEVCQKDLTTLTELGVSCDLISNELENVIEKANIIRQKSRNMGMNEAIVDGKFKVSGVGISSNGFQECPFSKGKDPCHIGRGNYTVENLTTKESISFTPLLISMIRDHAFFEGNIEYRLDPAKACRVLGLLPDAGIKKRKIEERTWKFSSCDMITEKNEEAARKYAEKICIIDEFATAYLGLPVEDLDHLEQDDWKGDAPPPVDQRGRYCHIFNHKNREESFRPHVDGEPLDRSIQVRCVHVFKLHSRTVAKIETP
ncbi:MAG TPA: hypothetical protein VLE89_06035 [Chlamydiales bacterium]|nr:hypothetical protein [Chlamydiales bacterium]